MSNSVFWENDFSNLYGSETIWAFKIPNHLVLSFDLSLKHFDSHCFFHSTSSSAYPSCHPPSTLLNLHFSLITILFLSYQSPFHSYNLTIYWCFTWEEIYSFSLYWSPCSQSSTESIMHARLSPRTYPLIPNEVKTPANLNVQIFNPSFCHDNVLSRGVDFMQSDYYTQDVITSATPCITSQANQIIPSEMKAKLYQSDSISYSSR